MSIKELPPIFKADMLCKKASVTGTLYSGEMPIDKDDYSVIEGEMIGDFEFHQ